MELIADRFAVNDSGNAVDLATGDRVCLVSSTAAGPTEQAAWAERCAWFSAFVHPSLAQLLDYGVTGETTRFEAWRASPGWRGADAAARRAAARATRVLRANGRSPGSSEGVAVGCCAGVPVVIPDAAAGLMTDAGSSDLGDADRELLGVIRLPDRRLAPLAEMLGSPTSGRVTAFALWAPEGGGVGYGVRVLARAARLAGFVPVATASMSGRGVRELLKGRTLMIIAREDAESGWRRAVDASLDCAKPHVVLFAGHQVVRRVHTAALERRSFEALRASVRPASVVRRHVRQVSAAARRSQGLPDRFERLLFGEPAPVGRHTPHAGGHGAPDEADKNGIDWREPVRAAEESMTYESQSSAAAFGIAESRARSWPAPGELARLRKQVESARLLLANGRYQPGERSARQAMHAFARRGEWAPAADAALLLAQSLVRRGRLAEADAALDASRPWASQSRDLSLLHALAVLRGDVLVERGRLAEAEALLDTVLASAVSVDAPRTSAVLLALVRCLFWQGRWSEAWHRLSLAPPDAERLGEDACRLWTARARVSIARGRAADAVADAARARDIALSLGNPALCGVALYAGALAQLAVGDASQAEAAASRASEYLRSGHEPMQVMRVRLLRAEIARRQGRRGPAALLVRRLASTRGIALPVTVRARIDLLRDLLVSADAPDTAERRADAVGLPALRLFAPLRPSSVHATGPAADDIVELLQCCQAADEERAVLVAVSARLRTRLLATGVAFFAIENDAATAVAGEGGRVDPASACRVAAANQLVLPHHGGERVEAGVPVRYAGRPVGVLAANWTPAALWHPGDVSLLLSTGATAAGPALSALLARRENERHSRASAILGSSGSIALVRDAVERAASAPFSVLVEGESGSGKELVARLLHKLGARRDRPFCTLNCAALPEDLVESELFGHARGAFTGAVGERRGVFEEAHTSTLFLDEIGELSPRAQAKLLRVIQEGEIRRVGENGYRRIDVRLVTATNRDLRVEAAAGRFRADLLYRLDVIRVTLPPLRERREDVPLLAEHFWREATGQLGSRAALSAATLAALTRHDWPGNIRELQNVLAALAVRCPRRGVVSPSALPPQFHLQSGTDTFSLDAARRTFDRSFIRAALVRSGGHRTRAADELGVTRQGLAKLMARLQIDDESRAGGP